MTRRVSLVTQVLGMDCMLTCSAASEIVPCAGQANWKASSPPLQEGLGRNDEL
jgi:hypothetical protein